MPYFVCFVTRWLIADENIAGIDKIAGFCLNENFQNLRINRIFFLLASAKSFVRN